MLSLRSISFLSENEDDKALFQSYMAMIGSATGALWSCSPDLSADIVLIDTDNSSFFERFRSHVTSVVVGFGNAQVTGTHYHLSKPLSMRALGDLLAETVRDGFGQRDAIILRYMADMEHSQVVMEVAMEMVQGLACGQIDKESMARQMGISPSTLQRRLAAEGASFRQLQNDIRRDLAERYLLETQRPIKEVAYSLGFADLSNFTRAFRTWFGVSPREFRNSHRVEA